MKKKLLYIFATIILTIAVCPTNINAKVKQKYYTMTGVVYNFKYTMRYKNGTVLKGRGFDIYTHDGNIWQMVDTDTDLYFKDGTKVKIKFSNNGTRKDKTDDIIINVKKIKKRNKK